MVRPDRTLGQRHFRLVGGLTSLAVVAPDAGADQVLPGILTTAGLRDHMIDRQRDTARTAILALVPIAAENVLSR